MKKLKTLTEYEWTKVFTARCKSKRGETLTEAERDLVDAAFESDPKRYGSMNRDVFNATAPFGSGVRK